jgi:hypothetical protein
MTRLRRQSLKHNAEGIMRSVREEPEPQSAADAAA